MKKFKKEIIYVVISLVWTFFVIFGFYLRYSFPVFTWLDGAIYFFEIFILLNLVDMITKEKENEKSA